MHAFRKQTELDALWLVPCAGCSVCKRRSLPSRLVLDLGCSPQWSELHFCLADGLQGAACWSERECVNLKHADGGGDEAASLDSLTCRVR